MRDYGDGISSSSETQISDTEGIIVATSTNNIFEVTHLLELISDVDGCDADVLRMTITIENISPNTIDNMYYVRIADWDVSGTTNYATMQGVSNLFTPEGPLVRTGNRWSSSHYVSDIFTQDVTSSCTGSETENQDFFETGPCDQGLYWAFNFGELSSGSSIEFTLYHGVSLTRNNAVACATGNDINAQLYGYLVDGSNVQDDITGFVAWPGDFEGCYGIEECENDPCLESESGNCRVYHEGRGCSQCNNGYFKRDFEYPCVQCQETFGNECMHCSDFNGCQQCINGYDRTLDQDCGLHYCKPNPCADPSNNCRVCNNGFCSQCNNNYVTLSNEATECVHCQETFGDGCMHCDNANGCQQCSNGYERVFNNGLSRYFCVVPP